MCGSLGGFLVDTKDVFQASSVANKEITQSECLFGGATCPSVVRWRRRSSRHGSMQPVVATLHYMLGDAGEVGGAEVWL